MFRIYSLKYIAIIIILAVSPFMINSCVDTSNSTGSDSTAGGGISGTGISTGIITGFGSVFVNGVEYDITDAVKIVDANSAAVEDDFEIGMKVKLDIENGKVKSIEYEPEVKGSITGIDITNNTITVLGQTIIVDSTTIFKNVNDLSGLNDGDIVEISGFFDADGKIRVTFIELENPDTTEFEVKGEVLNHDPDAKTFQIIDLTVDYNNVSNPPALVDGSFVEVKGELQNENLIAAEIELKDTVTASNPDEEMGVEGIITKVDSINDFEVNGQRVQTDTQTIFKNGTENDIAENVRVEVEGIVDDNGILIAEKVEFRFHNEREFKIGGRVDAIDTENSTVTIFGITITVNTNTQLKDDRDQMRTFTLDDIAINDFIEFGGFVESNDILVALKIERNDDEQREGRDKLKGPVDSETPPDSLKILGIDINVGGNLVEIKDMNDSIIDLSTFFDRIDNGDIVEVKGDFLNGIFTANEAEIERLN